MQYTLSSNDDAALVASFEMSRSFVFVPMPVVVAPRAPQTRPLPPWVGELAKAGLSVGLDLLIQWSEKQKKRRK